MPVATPSVRVAGFELWDDFDRDISESALRSWFLASCVERQLTDDPTEVVLSEGEASLLEDIAKELRFRLETERHSPGPTSADFWRYLEVCVVKMGKRARALLGGDANFQVTPGVGGSGAAPGLEDLGGDDGSD